jgi:hypothetical protein
VGSEMCIRFRRWVVALSILDRALMECDRGLKLLEQTTKPSGGTIIIGPIT